MPPIRKTPFWKTALKKLFYLAAPTLVRFSFVLVCISLGIPFLYTAMILGADYLSAAATIVRGK